MIFKERKIWLSPLILLLAFWLGGCSSRNDEPSPMGPQGISLVLNISTGDVASFGSRADDYSFEQAILDTEKIRSLRIIIVDTQEGSETQNKVVAYHETGILSYARFNISGIRFDGLNFSNSYRIYLVANENTLPSTIKDYLKSLTEGVSYDSYLETCLLNTHNIGSGNFLFSNESNSHFTGPIPMTEFFDITTDPRPDTTAEDIIVYMQRDFFITRAASKFTFNIKKSEDYVEVTEHSTIKSIKLFGLSGSEYLFPNNTTYNPSKYSPSSNDFGGREIVGFATPPTDPLYYTFDLPEEGIQISDISEEGISYSPSVYFSESKGVVGKFYCSIFFENGTESEIKELTNLPHGLPRNTHVIVNITLSNDGVMLLSVEIVPWVVNTLFLNYTQTVVVNPTLVWDDMTFESYDNSTGIIEVKTWSHNPKPVVGTFTIQEPVGATWTAYLLPKDGSPSAFSFCYYDEEMESYQPIGFNYIAGIIDGEEIELAICSTMETISEENSAILQVLVRLENGTILEAPLVSKNYPFSRYTFVQKPL